MTRPVFVRAVGAAVTVGWCVAALVAAQPSGGTAVVDAAMRSEKDGVRTLLRQGADVNTAQGDGMTALHWAALHDDAELAATLLYAGANVRATTRLGGYTALHLASQRGTASVIDVLAKAGSAVDATTSTGATPLMLAATSGSVDAVTRLIERGADVNVRERAQGQTALMFAAALDRADVVRLLMDRGADAGATSSVVDIGAGSAAPGDEALRQATSRRAPAPAAEAKPAREPRAAEPAPPAREPEPRSSTQRSPTAAASGSARQSAAPPAPPDVPGVTRSFTYNELIGKHGGLAALHFAARQGSMPSVQALVDAGADINQPSAGDRTTPLLIAAVNGHFDIAKYLLDKGADPTLASDAGTTPLYGVINVQWAPKAFYPQPRAYLQQQHSYLDLMTAFLERGADPNVRLRRKVWYSTYNFDNLRIDEIGATPFWRAAYASDLDAMKLLLSYGADPNIPTMKPGGRTRRGADDMREVVPDTSGLPTSGAGGPGIPPLQAAAGWGYGDGFAGNAHRFAPSGMMAAVKFLVEELGADVNERDYEGNTALHQAAARGDNEMIVYLVAKGADVTAVNRDGQTTADMANGPVQRIQPFADTVALLMKLGSKNSNKCVSC
jgi:uncharacterized protein